MTTPFDAYLPKIQADYKGGKATEHTYRSTLENLLESLHDHVEASNDPKHIQCGAPDFVVERRKVILGYVETKDVGEDLDKIEKSDQLKRYRESLNNLILTDYLEFRWYVNGERRMKARVATLGKGKKLQSDAAGIEQATTLFKGFYTTDAPIATTPKDLAQRMAAMTKMVRDLIVGALHEEAETGIFHQQLRAFQHHLLPNLTPGEFADIYAQTMAYGLFAARINAPTGKPFDRAQAYLYLPQANPFLRRLFLDVGEELDDTVIAPFLDDLATLLRRAEMDEILKDFGRRTRTEDPVVHFYQTFLAAYDPKLRESRGVYYTPEPAVHFIVNSIDALLRREFNRPLGLADPEVFVLDPATGTATFIYALIQSVYRTLEARGQLGTWPDYVRDHLLKRLFGFELLMAPYTIAHLKLSLLLNDLGYTFGKHERLGVFLTNTLEEAVTHREVLPGLNGYLSEEGNAAATVKKYNPIMVVLGNPPYSYKSINNSVWIIKLVRDYYHVDGKPLGERNPKGLRDDFVKFIRYAEWRIEQNGYGVVGYITNHSYLDNPTSRGMRQHLLHTFDALYVLDLHGYITKEETAPDGGKDENVFDIQQGVAILLAVKFPRRDNAPRVPQLARMYHAHLYGLREAKYAYLTEQNVTTVKWAELQPNSPFYFFVPQNESLRAEYESGWKITEVMRANSVGIVTSRDDLAVHMSLQSAKKTIKQFASLPIEDARHTFDLGVDSRDWQVALAQADLRSTHLADKHFVEMYYRPFDIRFTYYTGHSRGFHSMPRPAIMQQMAFDNIALLTSRLTKGELFAHVQVTTCISEKIAMSPKTSNNSFHFPLYLYSSPMNESGQMRLQTEVTREPNLAPGFIKDLSDRLALPFDPNDAATHTNVTQNAFTPEDVFHYIYAIFHSPIYRTRYAEFLKIDFPRVPLTSNRKLFFKLADLGTELVDLHLLRAPALNNFITTYPVKGSNEVVKVRYAPSPEHRGRAGVGAVHINDTQYFGNVPDAVWNFKVGGYQVCDKWLKDRKGRTLSSDDINHYQRIVVALHETMRLMKEIDQAIPAWPVE